MEHRAGIEPANTGFADQRVSHFATGAHRAAALKLTEEELNTAFEKDITSPNKNPTVLRERVGSLRLDSLDSNLSLSTRPHGAAATAAAGTCRDVSIDSH